MPKKISSVQNSYVKELFQLKEKSRFRKKTNRFLIEGKREILMAIKGNYKIESILYDSSIISFERVQSIINNDHLEYLDVGSNVYHKLSYRSTTEGVIAIAEAKELRLQNIVFQSSTPLILIAEAPEKPGNIGALLRTSDAAKVDAFLIANPKSDIYNPNIIRSSVGCVFTNQIATGTTLEIIEFLRSKKVSIFCATLSEQAEDYNKQDFTKSTAIVVGTESVGLSKDWLNNSSKNIVIPMQGEIDSLNVSVSAGILIFEAKRQRNFV